MDEEEAELWSRYLTLRFGSCEDIGKLMRFHFPFFYLFHSMLSRSRQQDNFCMRTCSLRIATRYRVLAFLSYVLE